MMKYGIAIHEGDPGILIKDFIVEANLGALPLSMLAFETQDYARMAERLGLEKIGLTTMYSGSDRAVFKQEVFDNIIASNYDRVYFRMFGPFGDIDGVMRLFTELLKIERRVGFISPIGEIIRENSFTRKILGIGCKGLEYVPLITTSTKISQEVFQSIKNVNEKEFTVILSPLSVKPSIVLDWINNFLVPNGVSEVIYSSMICAKLEYYPEENDMVTRKRTSTGKTSIRKKKEILLPPPGEPVNAKVEVLFPLAKRSTPHLNSMVVGSCEVGEKYEIIKIHELTPSLAFAETKLGFYICTKNNGIDYVRYI